MTTWTDISGASVAVGGIPSSATVTALRDNPSALAETASGAPVMRSGWHPVDKVTVGDGKDGLIYDFAVDGGLADIITPDFEDGYEYRLIAADLAPATSSTQTIDFYKQTDGSYYNALTLGSGSPDTTPRGFDLELRTPRLALKTHTGIGISYAGSSAATATVASAYRATAQKILRVRIRFTTVPVTQAASGKVWLLRRRDYTSLP